MGSSSSTADPKPIENEQWKTYQGSQSVSLAQSHPQHSSLKLSSAGVEVKPVSSVSISSRSSDRGSSIFSSISEKEFMVPITHPLDRVTEAVLAIIMAADCIPDSKAEEKRLRIQQCYPILDEAMRLASEGVESGATSSMAGSSPPPPPSPLLLLLVYAREGQCCLLQQCVEDAKNLFLQAIALAEHEIAQRGRMPEEEIPVVVVLLSRYVQAMIGLSHVWYAEERAKGFFYTQQAELQRQRQLQLIEEQEGFSPRSGRGSVDASIASVHSSVTEESLYRRLNGAPANTARQVAMLSHLMGSHASRGSSSSRASSSVFSLNYHLLQSLLPHPPRRATGPHMQTVRVHTPHISEETEYLHALEEEFVLYSKMPRELLASPSELLLLRCCEVVEVVHSRFSPLLLPVLETLANLYEELDLYESAILLLRRAVGILLAVYDYDYPLVLRVLQRIEMLGSKRDMQRKEKMATKIQSIWRMHYCMQQLSRVLQRPVHRHVWIPGTSRPSHDEGFLEHFWLHQEEEETTEEGSRSVGPEAEKEVHPASSRPVPAPSLSSASSSSMSTTKTSPSSSSAPVASPPLPPGVPQAPPPPASSLSSNVVDRRPRRTSGRGRNTKGDVGHGTTSSVSSSSPSSSSSDGVLRGGRGLLPSLSPTSLVPPSPPSSTPPTSNASSVPISVHPVASVSLSNHSSPVFSNGRSLPHPTSSTSGLHPTLYMPHTKVVGTTQETFTTSRVEEALPGWNQAPQGERTYGEDDTRRTHGAPPEEEEEEPQRGGHLLTVETTTITKLVSEEDEKRKNRNLPLGKLLPEGPPDEDEEVLEDQTTEKRAGRHANNPRGNVHLSSPVQRPSSPPASSGEREQERESLPVLPSGGGGRSRPKPKKHDPIPKGGTPTTGVAHSTHTLAPQEAAATHRGEHKTPPACIAHTRPALEEGPHTTVETTVMPTAGGEVVTIRQVTVTRTITEEEEVEEEEEEEVREEAVAVAALRQEVQYCQERRGQRMHRTHSNAVVTEGSSYDKGILLEEGEQNEEWKRRGSGGYRPDNSPRHSRRGSGARHTPPQSSFATSREDPSSGRMSYPSSTVPHTTAATTIVREGVSRGKHIQIKNGKQVVVEEEQMMSSAHSRDPMQRMEAGQERRSITGPSLLTTMNRVPLPLLSSSVPTSATTVPYSRGSEGAVYASSPTSSPATGEVEEVIPGSTSPPPQETRTGDTPESPHHTSPTYSHSTKPRERVMTLRKPVTTGGGTSNEKNRNGTSLPSNAIGTGSGRPAPQRVPPQGTPPSPVSSGNPPRNSFSLSSSSSFYSSPSAIRASAGSEMAPFSRPSKHTPQSKSSSSPTITTHSSSTPHSLPSLPSRETSSGYTPSLHPPEQFYYTPQPPPQESLQRRHGKPRGKEVQKSSRRESEEESHVARQQATTGTTSTTSSVAAGVPPAQATYSPRFTVQEESSFSASARGRWSSSGRSGGGGGGSGRDSWSGTGFSGRGESPGELALIGAVTSLDSQSHVSSILSGGRRHRAAWSAGGEEVSPSQRVGPR